MQHMCRNEANHYIESKAMLKTIVNIFVCLSVIPFVEFGCFEWIILFTTVEVLLKVLINSNSSTFSSSIGPLPKSVEVL